MEANVKDLEEALDVAYQVVLTSLTLRGGGVSKTLL